MLADWYFCCCIKTPPKLATTYLSILDTLADTSASSDLIHAAVSELRRCDVWMRAYALPAILALFSKSELRAVDDSWLHPYFDELFDSLPEDVADAFEDLKNVVLSDSVLTTELLDRCISKLDDSRNQSPSEIPYLDLQEHLAETIVLAVLA